MTYSHGMTGSELRAIRKRLGLTQQALAGQIGVASNSVARWERDEMKITEPVARLVLMLSTQKKGR